MFLTKDFNTEAAKLRKEMDALLKVRPAESFPVLSPDEWGMDAACYNLVINLPNAGSITPGAFSGVPPSDKNGDFNAYANGVRDGALKESLRFLGDSLEGLSDNETPAALFFRSKEDMPPAGNDFHWFMMRSVDSEARWIHKPGRKRPVETIPKNSNIFSFAKKNVYPHFGGYFAVPEKYFEEPEL